MKRRTFLAASGTVGIAGVVSGASVVSTVYTSMSTSILLEEFNVNTRNVLDKFMADVMLNTKALGLDENIATLLVMPAQIIDKKSTKNNQRIIYKNKSGDYISLSVTKGVERIEVFKTL